VTPEQVELCKRVCGKASPAPWTIDGGKYLAIIAVLARGSTQIGRLESFGGMRDEQVEANAEFVAVARTALPDLISERDRLRELLGLCLVAVECGNDMVLLKAIKAEGIE
jgi:hypothetical protein